MRRWYLFAGLLLGVACSMPMFAADDEKDAKKPEAKEDKESKPKMGSAGAIVGKLARVEGSQKYITVQISIPVLEPGGSGYHATGRGRRGISSGAGFHVKQITKDIELQTTDDFKVRMLQPPVDFDDKGKPKKYTSKELQDLKGPDPKLPGFMADFDSLKPNQLVKVYLAKRKDAPAPLVSKPKVKNKDDLENLPEDKSMPEATMVVILGEQKK